MSKDKDEEARKNLKIIFKAIGSKDCDTMGEVADRLEGKELVIFTQNVVALLGQMGENKYNKTSRRRFKMNPEKIKAHYKIKSIMLNAVTEVATLLPTNRDRAAYIKLMRQAQMMAQASIGIYGASAETQE